MEIWLSGREAAGVALCADVGKDFYLACSDVPLILALTSILGEKQAQTQNFPNLIWNISGFESCDSCSVGL